MSIAALESQLRAHLDEWDHWLVYGDWLSDQGDPRGALIRLDHRLETEALSAGEQRAIQRQIDQLVLSHGDAWKIPALPQTELTWSHGFVVGARILLGYPPLDAFLALLEHPQARLLARLDLGYHILSDAGVERLAASPGLAHVTALDLRYNHLSDEAIFALARSPYTGELAELHLHRCGLGARSAEALARSDLLAQLRLLDLRDNPIGPEGATALAQAPGLARVGLLRLYLADIGPEGAAALSQCPHPTLSRYWRARCP